ncbi:uncharacterized protein [Miscanthus floridulus]|uniref:uncharacterized protein n=1 Tax=Miscanthus floridulus TaxID=154761 RepID=UPI00345A05C1
MHNVFSILVEIDIVISQPVEENWGKSSDTGGPKRNTTTIGSLARSLAGSHARLGGGAASAAPSGGNVVPSAATSARGYGLNDHIRESEGGVRGDEERICGDGVQIHGSSVNWEEKRICGDGDHGERTSSSILSRFVDTKSKMDLNELLEAANM